LQTSLAIAGLRTGNGMAALVRLAEATPALLPGLLDHCMPCPDRPQTNGTLGPKELAVVGVVLVETVQLRSPNGLRNVVDRWPEGHDLDPISPEHENRLLGLSRTDSSRLPDTHRYVRTSRTWSGEVVSTMAPPISARIGVMPPDVALRGPEKQGIATGAIAFGTARTPEG
jgi:hypothetical protein